MKKLKDTIKELAENNQVIKRALPYDEKMLIEYGEEPVYCFICGDKINELFFLDDLEVCEACYDRAKEKA